MTVRGPNCPVPHVVAGSGESRAPRGSLVSPAAHGCPAIHRLCCAVGRACFFLTPPPITSPVDRFSTVSRQQLQAALHPSGSHNPGNRCPPFPLWPDHASLGGIECVPEDRRRL